MTSKELDRAKSRTIRDVLMTYEPRPSAEVAEALKEIETLIKASKPERYTNNTIELPETDYQIKAYVRSVHNQAIDDYEANLLKILGGER